MPLHTDVQENMILATRTPAEAVMSSSSPLERSLMRLSLSTTLSHSHRSFHGSEDTTPLLGDSGHCQGTLEPSAPARNSGTYSVRDSARVKLCIVWLAAFFSGCSIFTFNVIIADFIGKVLYGGSPDSDTHSTKYLLYQAGIRQASLSILILNVAYVALALCHSKVLTTLSPRTEYVTLAVAMAALTLLTRQSASLWLVYITAVVVGFNRAAMYTVPFVLATQLFEQAEAGKRGKGEGSKPRFGSLMSLVTSSLPSAYLVINIITGPLVDVTGDPSTPLLMAAFCSFLAACCMLVYKS